MSIFDTLFGNNATTSETRTALTGPATNAATTLFSKATDYANQGYTPYGANRVAGLTPDQLRAFNATRGIADSNASLFSQLSGMVQDGVAGRPVAEADRLAAASGNLAGLGTDAVQRLAVAFPDADISAYMNPYVQDVLNPAIRDLTDAAEKNRQALAGRAAMTGSFGGSRNALAMADAQQGTEEEIARLSANERARAFTEGTAQFRKDQEAIPALYAAGQALNTNALGALTAADNFERLGYQDIQNLMASNQGRLATEVNPLLTTGGLEQGMYQNLYDTNYQEFQNQQNWGMRGLDALTRAFGAGSGATGQTTQSTVTPPQPNPIGQVLGAGAGIVGSLGGLGGVANAAGSAVNWLGNQAGSWLGGGGGDAIGQVLGSGADVKSWFREGGLVGLPA